MQKARAADRKTGLGKSLQNHLFVSIRDTSSVRCLIAIMKCIFSMPNRAYIFEHEVTKKTCQQVDWSYLPNVKTLVVAPEIRALIIVSEPTKIFYPMKYTISKTVPSRMAV